MADARRVLRSVIGVAVLVGVVSPSVARAEFVLDLFTGVSDTSETDVEISQPAAGNRFTVRNLGLEDESFDDPPYYGFRVAYFFERLPWLGVGAEFFHFKVLGQTGATRQVTGTRGGAPISASVPVNSVVQRFDVSHGVNYLMFDVVARYGFLQDPETFPNGRLQVYLGGGVGPVITHAETRIEGVGAEPGYEVGGVGGQGFAGVRFLLFKHVGLFVEAKITRSSLTVGVARGGEASFDETTRHFVGGVTIAFP